jgi:hypothetical protein
LRNAATGHRTALEATTEFLRERVWGGEKIIALGHVLMGDMQRETGQIGDRTQTPAGTQAAGEPLAALIDWKYRDRVLSSNNLGIGLDRAQKTGLTPGAWYAANENQESMSVSFSRI